MREGGSDWGACLRGRRLTIVAEVFAPPSQIRLDLRDRGRPIPNGDGEVVSNTFLLLGSSPCGEAGRGADRRQVASFTCGFDSLLNFLGRNDAVGHRCYATWVHSMGDLPNSEYILYRCLGGTVIGGNRTAGSAGEFKIANEFQRRCPTI